MRATQRALAGLMATGAMCLSLVAAQEVQKQPQVKSQKEAEAVMAIFQAPDADSRIKAAQELLTKYADTEFKAIAMQMIAASYQQKNDFENMVVWAERTLEADPNNYHAMLMLATGLAQRTREFDLDREEKLARAEKYAHGAMDILKTLPKPRPDVPDDQWEAAKKDFTAQAHEALGLAALARKKYDVAIAEFKLALDGAANPDPATMVRLGTVYNMTGKYDDAIALLDKVMNDPQVHPTIKQFAQAERARAFQLKQASQQQAGAAQPVGGAKPAPEAKPEPKQP
ncbi:MAG: tetratricopeptide repeat protein [Bryobacteraceae bacterium]